MERITCEEAYNRFKPEPCVLVLSVDKNGKPSGMTAGWVMKTSIDPPLLAVSLQKKGYTHHLIRESKAFVIAVPNKALEDVVLFFGTTHGNEIDKFSYPGLETVPGSVVPIPLIKNATLNFECTLLKEIEAGDHFLYLGEICAVHANRDKKVLMNMGKRNGKRIFKEFEPLF
ncbi:MAG: flavin reductase family protein [Candidatus Marinimicrobia bacterium]|nr:flavin reductase family protein [Candidatus Neomarinimicrobiota bacterium]